MLLCKKPGGKLITAGLFSCGQSNPWALMTGPGPCGGWHLRQPRSCPPAGQRRPLCAGSGPVWPQSRGWEPCLPCCLGRLSYRLHWGKAAGAGQPPGPGLPRGTGAGPGCLLPVGVCAAPWRKPASCRAEGLGAQAQLMPPREGLLCAQSVQLENTQQEKASLPGATQRIKTRKPTQGATFRTESTTGGRKRDLNTRKGRPHTWGARSAS